MFLEALAAERARRLLHRLLVMMSSAVDRGPFGARVEPGELSEALARYEALKRGGSSAPVVTGALPRALPARALVPRRVLPPSLPVTPLCRPLSDIEWFARKDDERWLRGRASGGDHVAYRCLCNLIGRRERAAALRFYGGDHRLFFRSLASEKLWLAALHWQGWGWHIEQVESFDLFGEDGWRDVIRRVYRSFGRPPWSAVRLIVVRGTREAVSWHVDGLSGPPEGRTYSDGRELRALRGLFDRRQVLASGCWVSSPEAMHDYEDVLGVGRKVAAHKLVFEYQFGPVPPGFLVRHKCDVRACFRPDHLEIGTHLDNMRDKVERGRTGFRSVADRVAADELRVLGRTLQ